MLGNLKVFLYKFMSRMWRQTADENRVYGPVPGPLGPAPLQRGQVEPAVPDPHLKQDSDSA